MSTADFTYIELTLFGFRLLRSCHLLWMTVDVGATVVPDISNVASRLKTADSVEETVLLHSRQIIEPKDNATLNDLLLFRADGLGAETNDVYREMMHLNRTRHSRRGLQVRQFI